VILYFFLWLEFPQDPSHKTRPGYCTPSTSLWLAVRVNLRTIIFYFVHYLLVLLTLPPPHPAHALHHLPQPSWRHGGREARGKSRAAASAAMIATHDRADSRIGGPGYLAAPIFCAKSVASELKYCRACIRIVRPTRYQVQRACNFWIGFPLRINSPAPPF
jgi:hypothetical protein